MSEKSSNTTGLQSETEWAVVREHYVQGGIDVAGLAEAYPVSEAAIRRRRKAEMWDDQRRLMLDEVSVASRDAFGRELQQMAQSELLPALRDHSELCRTIRKAMRKELDDGGIYRASTEDGDVVHGKSAFNSHTLELLDRETKLLAMIVSGGAPVLDAEERGSLFTGSKETVIDSDAIEII